MSLTKITYVDEVTVIPASNLNEIQDAILSNEDDIANVQSDMQTLSNEIEGVQSDIEDLDDNIDYVNANKVDFDVFCGLEFGMCLEFKTLLYTRNMIINRSTGQLEPSGGDETRVSERFIVANNMDLDFNGWGIMASYDDSGAYITYDGFFPGSTVRTHTNGYVQFEFDENEDVPFSQVWVRNHSYVDDALDNINNTLGDIGEVLDSINGEVV